MRHLKAFHIFYIAAISSSYSEAAKKLNITHGAVSKQIKVLEDYLSIALFYKQGRHLYLTKEGELLKSYTSQAFQALDTGINKLLQVNKHYIEVSCEPTLTMRWLMPRLSEFYIESGTDVRLSTAGGPVTLGSNGLSLAIRRDDFELHLNYQKTVLVEEWVGPVMSPDYWQQVKGNLPDMKQLHSETRPHAWKDWLSYHAGSLRASKTQQTFAHFYFCLQAAVDGLGAAIGSYPLIMDDLKRGNLIAPFGFMLSGHRYILLSQESDSGQLEQFFSKWLQQSLQQAIPTNVEKEGLRNHAIK